MTLGPPNTQYQPYPGQRPYGSADQSSFYGREHEALEIAELWSAHQVTIVHGNAGVGKTSLIQAGLVSLLESSQADVLPLGRIIGGSHPPVLLDESRFASAFLSSLAAADVIGAASGISVTSFLRQRRQRRRSSTRTLLAIDQLEQLYRDGSRGRGDRELFLADLTQALGDDQDTHAVLLVRDERLADLVAERWATPPATFRLAGLSREAAIEATRNPLGGTGKSYAPGAAENLVDKLLGTTVLDESMRMTVSRDSALLPVLLQAACSALWDALPDGVAVITVADIVSLIDVDEVLARFISSAAGATAQYYDLSPAWLCSWLGRALVTEAGTRAAVPEHDVKVGELRAGVLRALEDRHVVSSAVRAGLRWFELSANRLIGPVHLAARSAAGGSPPGAPVTLTDRLDQAANALAEDDLAIAERNAQLVLDTAARGELRLRGRASMVLGNIAFQQGHTEEARRRYLAAAEFYEAIQDQLTVGHLLAAIGRIHLMEWDAAAALSALHSAASRLPSDGAVLMDLARAFATFGETQAAVAVLGSARFADAEDGLQQASEAADGIESATGESRDGPLLLRAARVRALRGDYAGAESLILRAMEAAAPG
jgi:hypothetical protein